VEDVFAANPKVVADIEGGKAGAVGSLVGQVMKMSGGRANPQTVQRLVRDKLKI
jgi:aspartyl-tRNA(Asn)/glutamyl-tRNA(Gln) amidotransferase subunit B